MEFSCLDLEDLDKDLQLLQNHFDRSFALANEFNAKIKDFTKKSKSRAPEFKIADIVNLYNGKCKALNEKVKLIRQKLKDEVLKIFLFGKVSVGKSTFINAILGKDLFCKSRSHTTSCIVRIRKSDDNIHSIKWENRKTSCQSMESLKTDIKQLSTEFSNDSNKLNFNQYLYVYLNIENKILKKNVEIIDCPGCFREKMVTDHVKKEALSANIFIFVMEHIISDEEKEFFHYVSNLSSKPIIFVIVNKWDETKEDDPEITRQSKNMIREELKVFLANENENSTDAINRIFFVSSSKTLKNKTKPSNGDNQEYLKEIFEEFISFENTLSDFMIDFFKNKSKIYKHDKSEAENNIREIFNGFEKEIEKLKSKNLQWNSKATEIKESMTLSRNKFESKFNEDIEIINNKMEETYKKYISTLNRETITQFENDVNMLKLNSENQLLISEKEINEIIESEIKIYEEFTGYRKKKEKCVLKEIAQKEIMLQKISLSFWQNIWDKIVQFFTTANYFAKFTAEKDCDIMQENTQKLETFKTEFDLEMKENKEILLGKIQKPIFAMNEVLEFQMECFNKFWADMDNIMKLYKTIVSDT